MRVMCVLLACLVSTMLLGNHVAWLVGSRLLVVAQVSLGWWWWWQQVDGAALVAVRLWLGGEVLDFVCGDAQVVRDHIMPPMCAGGEGSHHASHAAHATHASHASAAASHGHGRIFLRDLRDHALRGGQQ